MEFSKPAGSTEEFLVCTALLPAIRKRYGSTFVLLEIPEVLRSDEGVGQNGTVYFRDYAGEKYNARWSEHNGGAGLGPELCSEMVRLLEDFQRIDIAWLLPLHAIGERVKASAFDLQGWLLSFQQQKTQALRMGISAGEFGRAEEFIRAGFHFEGRIFSNGDFYARNLIKLPGRMVVVDWGYWTGFRPCFVDYLVNVAAFAFIHMWGNALWQKEFVRSLREALDIKVDDLRKAILIKSFEQARFWQQGAPQFVSAQVNHFRMALRDGNLG